MNTMVDAIKNHPEHAKAQARLQLERCCELIAESVKLLKEPTHVVSLEDKRQLICEIKAAVANATVCVNIEQASEIEAKAMVVLMEQKAGWLL